MKEDNMKQGWEIKKLGEVCEVIGGSTPKTNESTYWNGDFFWVTPAELDGTKLISSTKRTITEAGVKSAHLQLLPAGTVLLSSRAPIGKVAITTVPMYCNQGFKNLICSDKLYNCYAYWFLYANTEYLNALGTGATFKEISKKVVEQIPIPVPPLPVQERIVSELDLLSGIIEKKREQLKELDALAQSIFYDMFGDPITNEKGWEVKKLGEVCVIERGGSPRPINAFLTDMEDGINWIKIGDATSGSRYITSTKEKIKPEGIKKSRMVYKGDFILSNSMSFGKPYILGIDGCIHDGWLLLRDNNNTFDKNFLYYYLTSPNIYLEFKRLAVGGVVNNLNSELVRSVNVAIPPLPLQHQFASKIEAIERQKELIKQSISETETLFNERMQHYFS